MIDTNTNENIKKLIKEFNRIKKMEYVKTVRNGPTGIGATFEKLLGKQEDSLEIPDYYGIEIKTKRAYSKSYITLFNCVPTGSTFHETKRLRDRYGYPSKKDKNVKALNVEVFSTELTKVGLWYYFKFKIEKGREQIVLQIYNYKKELIDTSTYWDFDILKEKLERKLQVLALIQAWTNKINGFEYFKYYKIDIYFLKKFNNFVEALEKGKIKISFKVESYTNEKKYGKICEHGVGFSIQEKDLTDIFNTIK